MTQHDQGFFQLIRVGAVMAARYAGTASTAGVRTDLGVGATALSWVVTLGSGADGITATLADSAASGSLPLSCTVLAVTQGIRNCLKYLLSAADALHDVPSVQATSKTLELSDRGCSIDGTGGVITIPLSSVVAFPVGTVIIINNTGASVRTVSPVSGVTLRLAGSTSVGARTVGPYGEGRLRREPGANAWKFSGVGVG